MEVQKLLNDIENLPQKDFNSLRNFFEKNDLLIQEEDGSKSLDFDDLSTSLFKRLQKLMKKKFQKLSAEEEDIFTQNYAKLTDEESQELFQTLKSEKLLPQGLEENFEVEIDLQNLAYETAKRISDLTKKFLKKREPVNHKGKIKLLNVDRFLKANISEKPFVSKSFNLLFAIGEHGDEKLRGVSAGRLFITRQHIGYNELPFCFSVTLDSPFWGKIFLEGSFDNAYNSPESNMIPVSKGDHAIHNNTGIGCVGSLNDLVLKQGKREYDVIKNASYELKALGSQEGKNINKPLPMVIFIHFFMNLNKFLDPIKHLREKHEYENKRVTLICNIFDQFNTAETRLVSFRPIANSKNTPEEVLGRGSECVRNKLERVKRRSELEPKKENEIVPETTEERKLRLKKKKERRIYIDDLMSRDNARTKDDVFTLEEERIIKREHRKYERRTLREKKKKEGLKKKSSSTSRSKSKSKSKSKSRSRSRSVDDDSGSESESEKY